MGEASIILVRNLKEIDHFRTLRVDEGAEGGGVVVKAPRFKPAGRGFDSRWCHWNFSVT
jgi:hypothetical protein